MTDSPAFPIPTHGLGADETPHNTSAGTDLSALTDLRATVIGELRKVIVGQEAILEHLLVALIARGHILLEGVPGVAKTLMVRVLAHVIDADFKRIQFTPDLMPSDILGTNIFSLQDQTFRLIQGPIFTDLCLADEINRAPAKTQSALLEAMEERTVSIDGHRHDLGSLFMVCATQNPVESEGTYPLPEAQLDRFLLKVKVPYPTADEEDRILEKFNAGFDPHDIKGAGVEQKVDKASIVEARELVNKVRVQPQIIRYIRQIVHGTRSSPSLMLGGGPRASIYLLTCSKVAAGLRGRDFVTPDDVKFMAYPVLRHRLILEPEVELDGISTEEIIGQILSTIEVPR
jgi:MoxR-like ATPase